MTNDDLMAAVLALPDADLMMPTTIDAPIGAGTYYRADTVARLLAAERERYAAAPMPSHPITRADSVALWHAVDAMKWAVKALRDMPDMEKHLPGEIQRLEAAQKALRKVQALVRASKGARR